jgi:hypothetical protein
VQVTTSTADPARSSASGAAPRTRRDQLVDEVREWEQLAADCTDGRPKERLDILKGLQAKRAELHAHDAAQRIKALDVERAARERSALALSAGSHVAALGHARQAEQERIAREDRERAARDQALARETPASALAQLVDRLRALPAGQLRRVVDGIGSALHLAPGVPCPCCGRPTGEAVVEAPAGVAAAAPALRPEYAPDQTAQEAPGARQVVGVPAVLAQSPGAVLAAPAAAGPAPRPAPRPPRRVVGAPGGDQ